MALSLCQNVPRLGLLCQNTIDRDNDEMKTDFERRIRLRRAIIYLPLQAKLLFDGPSEERAAWERTAFSTHSFRCCNGIGRDKRKGLFRRNTLLRRAIVYSLILDKQSRWR